MDFDKRQYSGKSEYKSPTLINLDSISVSRKGKKQANSNIKTFKSKYVM